MGKTSSSEESSTGGGLEETEGELELTLENIRCV